MSFEHSKIVWEQTRFKGNTLLVLLCLAKHANEAGICWPAHETIANHVRCSRRQVLRIMKELEADGWFTVERRFFSGLQASSVYQLTLRCDISDMPAPGDICDTNRVTFEAFQMSQMSHRIVRNHNGITNPMPLASVACTDDEPFDVSEEMPQITKTTA